MAEAVEEVEGYVDGEAAELIDETTEDKIEVAQRLLAAHFDGLHDDASLEELNAEYTVLLDGLSKCKGDRLIGSIDLICMYIHHFDSPIQLRAIDELTLLFKSANEEVKYVLNDHFAIVCETITNSDGVMKVLEVILDEICEGEESSLLEALNKNVMTCTVSHPAELMQSIGNVYARNTSTKLLEILRMWREGEDSLTRTREDLVMLCKCGKEVQKKLSSLEEEALQTIEESIQSLIDLWKKMGSLEEEDLDDSRSFDVKEFGEDEQQLLDSLVSDEDSDEEGAIEEEEIPFTRVPDTNAPSTLLEFHHLAPSLDTSRYKQYLERFGEVVHLERMDDRPLLVQFKSIEVAAYVKSMLDGKRMRNRVIQVIFGKREVSSIMGSSEGFRLLRNGMSIMRGAMRGSGRGELTALTNPRGVSSRGRMMGRGDGYGGQGSYGMNVSPYNGHMGMYPPGRPSRMLPLRPNVHGAYLNHMSAPLRGYGYGGYPLQSRGAVLRPPLHPYLSYPHSDLIDDTNLSPVPHHGADGINNGVSTSAMKARLTPRELISHTPNDLSTSASLGDRASEAKTYRERIPLETRLHQPVSNWSEDQSIDEQMEDYRQLVKRFSFVNRYLIVQDLPAYLESEEDTRKWAEEILQDSDFEIEILEDREKQRIVHFTFKTKKNAVEAHKKFIECNEGIKCEHAGPRKANCCLWLGNVRDCMSSADVRNMFEKFGKLNRWKFLPDRTCGFVAYENVEDAITARNHLFGVLGSKEVCLNVDFSPGDSTLDLQGKRSGIPPPPLSTGPHGVVQSIGMRNHSSGYGVDRIGSGHPTHYESSYGMLQHSSHGLSQHPHNPHGRITAGGATQGDRASTSSLRPHGGGGMVGAPNMGNRSSNQLVGSSNTLSEALLDLLSNPEMLELARERLLATGGASKGSSFSKSGGHSKRYGGYRDGHHRSHSGERRRTHHRSSLQKPYRHTHSPHSTNVSYARRSVSVGSSSDREWSSERDPHGHRGMGNHAIDGKKMSSRVGMRGRRSRSPPSRETLPKKSRRSLSDERPQSGGIKRRESPSVKKRHHDIGAHESDAFASKPPALKQSRVNDVREAACSVETPVTTQPDNGSPTSNQLGTRKPVHLTADDATTEVTNQASHPSTSFNGDALLIVCKVTKQGRGSCNMSAKYISGNAEMKLEAELNLGQRTQFDRLKTHLKNAGRYSLWQLGADTRNDSRHYDELCDYFIKKDRIGLVECDSTDVYLVPPNINYVKPLNLPDANFMYAFVLEKGGLE